MPESKFIPKILIIKYSYDPENLPAVYHLILDDIYEGCYATKADLLERLSMMIVNGVSEL